jgi:hypothetical protein
MTFKKLRHFWGDIRFAKCSVVCVSPFRDILASLAFFIAMAPDTKASHAYVVMSLDKAEVNPIILKLKRK